MARETVSGIKHPAFRDAVALTRAGGREATGRYLVEDKNLVRQALAESSPSPVYAVFAEAGEAHEWEEACHARRVPLYVLGAGLLNKLLGTGYSTAISAVAVVGRRPLTIEAVLKARPDALILAGERIQDPRNVGVLIRTAEASGCAALLLSDDSAEPYSRQAMRSTTGSLLRLPVVSVPDLPATLARLRDTHGVTVAATSGQAPLVAYQADLAVRPLVLLMGNEQDGVSARALGASTLAVRLPMPPESGADSLNVTVAAGALLFEAVRQKGDWTGKDEG